jgi:hypothetical protein
MTLDSKSRGKYTNVTELIDYDHNVLFITLDSCRWDTYKLAKTPNLDRIGKAKPAQTHASFTLPAHHAFFAGHIPSTGKDEDFYSRSGAYLWRLNGATPNKKKIGVFLKGDSVIDGYRKKGHKIKGFAGVSIFSKENASLRKYFKKSEFAHYGLFSYHHPRTSRKTSPLFNLKDIVSFMKKSKSWFVFINEGATHSPYNLKPMNKSAKSLLREVAPSFGGVQTAASKKSYKQGKMLHKIQIETVEILDKQIGKLLDAAPKDKPILIIICADHGQMFGEHGKWGHFHNKKEVLTVPLLINTKYV